MSEPTTTTTTAVAPKSDNKSRMSLMLKQDQIKSKFDQALNEASGPFIASITEIYASDSYLSVCEPGLVVQEALKAAILKLPILKSLGFAYIVPYKKNGASIPQFQIGYKGYIQLAMRTGQYKTINADIVYEGELREVNKLAGTIAFDGKRKSDKEVGYFAYVELLNGFSKTLYMTKDDVLKHAKKYS